MRVVQHRSKVAGSRRLLVVLYVASGVLALGEGSIGIMLPPLLDARGFEPGRIGVVLSVYGVASLAMRLVGGVVYTAARAPALIGGGCLLTAASFALLPFAPGTALVAALVALDGLGFSLATTGVLAVIMDRRPPELEAGPVMAWYTGMTGLGFAVAGFFGGWLGDHVGLEHGMIVLAVVPLLTAGMFWAAVPGSESSDPTQLAQHPRAQSRVASVWGLWSLLGSLSPVVWLAFSVTLYINLNLGVLQTFFPIHGLDIGLSLTEIGALASIHSFVAAAVRFLSGSLFRRVSYERCMLAMVLTGSAAVAGIALGTNFWLLVPLWSLLGLSRGVLRVASGALVLDAAHPSDRQRGAASAVYLGGLDLGRIVGPLVGGALVGVTGMRGAFLAVAFGFPGVYAILAWLVHGRDRHTDARTP